MAGTLAQTNTYNPGAPQQVVNRIALAWTSDASGNVNGNPSSPIYGTILKVEFVPGTGGSQPINGYSVTLTDAAGVDVLAGQGAGLGNATPTAVCPGVPLKDGTSVGSAPCAVADALALNVSGAGNAKSGSVILYVR